MANGHGGKREGSGRKSGSPTKRRREIIDEAAKDGITPLEVQLLTMRALWDAANNGPALDFDKATAACAIAKDCAMYIHPRLSSVEAQVAISGHEAALEELDAPKPMKFIEEVDASKPVKLARALPST
jgi:hypothetical protein